MARGWESKAVADQMDEADMRASAQETARSDKSPEGRERRERLESLRLSRARALEQLTRATNHKHREMLERTLRALETEMEKLGLSGE